MTALAEQLLEEIKADCPAGDCSARIETFDRTATDLESESWHKVLCAIGPVRVLWGFEAKASSSCKT